MRDALENFTARAFRFVSRKGREFSESRRFLFEGLGRNFLPKASPRCLIGYVPDFVAHVCRHPDVTRNGWEPNSLGPRLRQLARSFSAHTMYWESAELVRQCIALGYVVDYVDGRRGYLVKEPEKYDLIIDEWINLPGWARRNSSARRLFYATGAHWIHHNKAEITRHAWLFGRRGVDGPTQREVPALLGPQVADLISSFGNSAVNATFGIHAPKTRKLWISAVDEDVPLRRRDWSRARNSFLWFGGSGWILKGLDLTVEAFLQEPSLRLHIVGGDLERGGLFAATYGRQIEEAGNITVHGWMDVCGAQFHDLASECAALVYPSASDSGAGVQCLHHGLIPLVTPNTGLEIHGSWPAIEGESDQAMIAAIRRRCREIAEMPEQDLEAWQRHFWKFARENHTHDSYSGSLAKVLAELVREDRPVRNETPLRSSPG